MASFTVHCPKFLCFDPLGLNIQRVSGLGLKKSQSLGFGSLSFESASNGIQCLKKKQLSVWKFQATPIEAVSVENSSNSAPARVNEPKLEEKADHNGKPPGPSISADESSISAFMSQVSDLVYLVDSRDIVELELKQAGYELLIRKKEALQPPPASVVAPVSQPYFYPQYPSQQAPPPPPPPQPSVASSAPASKPLKEVLALTAPKKSASSHPPFKCPMAGTFYRCPGPGEPPFVKVGDKVKKGQVLCIVEAMKLMNEIEADREGTITEILLEDAKPVSVDLPLFVIAP